MLRARPIPPQVVSLFVVSHPSDIESLLFQVLEKAEAGELQALRSLTLLVTAKYATTQIVEIAFKILTASAPEPELKTASALVAGTRPGHALVMLWVLIGGKDELKPEVRELLVTSLLDFGDSVFSWIKFCLRTGVPCSREDIVQEHSGGRLSRYVIQASSIMHLLHFDKECGLVLSSSTAFIELFLEFWLAGKRHGAGQTQWVSRLVDCHCDDGCAIIELAFLVLTKPHSQDAFLAHCRTGKQCDRFCSALMERVLYGFVHTHALMGWSHSLYWLLSTTDSLCLSSPLIRRRLERMDYLKAFTQEISAFACSIDSSGEAPAAAFMTVSCLRVLMNCALGPDDSREHVSQIRRNMTGLAEGDFLSPLLSTTETVIIRADKEEDLMKKILSMVDVVRHYMVYPDTFGCTDPSDALPMPDAVRNHPRAFIAWTSLLKRLDRARTAHEALKKRPTVYLCDNPFCFLQVVGKEDFDTSKECAGCSSVVYCSVECQKQDWEGRHRGVCGHAYRIHESQKQKYEVYDHRTRSSHAAFPEAVYAEFDCDAYANPTILPIFMCRGVPLDGSEWESSIEDLNSCYMHWADCSEGQSHLQERARTLISLYRFGDIPSGWRLAEGIFPVNGNEFYRSYHLLALLQPENGGYKTVYCIACHRFAKPGTTLKHETVPVSPKWSHDRNSALDEID